MHTHMIKTGQLSLKITVTKDKSSITTCKTVVQQFNSHLATYVASYICCKNNLIILAIICVDDSR